MANTLPCLARAPSRCDHTFVARGCCRIHYSRELFDDEIGRIMLSDIEIAQRATLRPIVELARRSLQIPERELQP